ncbi:probable E3 ubiquitin-protein ligase RHY1A [Magnolia sinica]|uniref:probable E3 ubiquitin-protein ligase RHY1A n=1 Tax=Magnolia sinica TaxID=86752 RepID=UPI00265AB300|nr:probable E3 ubiquitin-protein ligase RHY1A [Magnolia sinica]
MTSASELFHTRRSRIGRNTELGFGPSIDRVPHHRHHRYHRHEEDCDPVRRSSHGPSLNARYLCNRVSQAEREPVRLDHSTSQSGTGNISGTETSSSRTNTPRFSRNERLPGAVLQARARLLERLRGVSLTGNRQSSRGSGISWDEFAISDDFRVVDTGDWESEISRLWFADATPYTELNVQRDPSSILLDMTKKKPPGLSLEAINSLQQEVFTIADGADGDVVLSAVHECCICLESFQDGDRLICLPCRHGFHPTCLDPWVRTCGDCPYCRTDILVDDRVERKTLNPQ